MTRAPWLLALALALLAGAQAGWAAPDCGTTLARRKVTIVVPFRPGGGNDGYARVFAPALQERTGARVVVTNLTGANGLTGVRAVSAAAGDALVLGVFDLRDLMPARLVDPAVPSPREFVALGSFGNSIGIWATRKDTGDLLAGSQPLTFGASTGMMPRILLPALLMDREVRLVRGYGGLAERWLALLRGDVDVTDGSLDSISRFIAGAPGTRALLVLSAQPLPGHPGVPYLAGPGGVVDQHTRQLDAATRRERLELAEVAAELSTSARTIAVTSKVPDGLRHCLDEAVEGTLFSPQLREAAARLKLSFEPLRGAQVRAQLSRLEAVTDRNAAILRRLAAGQ